MSLQRKVENKKGEPYEKWVALVYGEFKGQFGIFRYPQSVPGLTWKKIVQALQKVLKSELGLKPNGFWNVDSVMNSDRDSVAGMIETSNTPIKLDFDEKTGTFLFVSN